MVIQCCDDVQLETVSKALRELATCYLQRPTPSLSSGQLSCWPFERLLLLQLRSKDVLSEFSGYFCLRLLLDMESPLATYFIDLFYELEWLLEALLPKPRTSSSGVSVNNMPLAEDLREKIIGLLHSIKPAVNSCRYLFAISRLTPSLYSRRLSTGKEMKREGKAYRDFSMDTFRSSTKMLSFVNLDEYSNGNKVELGKILGKGALGEVYEGHFMTENSSNHPQRRTMGEPVAVKVLADGRTGSCKSFGSQFFDQMEKMVKLKGSTDNSNTFMNARQLILSEELWKLVSAKHPNIVTARGYIGRRPQGESGLVMELMDESLQDHLDKQGEKPLEELEMIDLMLEIAKGMRFLQECDLVHKDLKPANILLRSCKQLGTWKNCPAMEVKLADFGVTQRVVQEMEESAFEATHEGTYCYMAPEMLQLVIYQPVYQDKVDVFSYGTTCFNILTCESPKARKFTRKHTKAESEKFYKRVESSYWRMWVKGKPEYLVDLVARCWDFDPSRRPTFATICSLLQRAMVCILSSPVINVTTLSNFQQNSIKHSSLNLYKTLTWSSDVPFQLIGTRMMQSGLEELRTEINRGDHKRSNLIEDATRFVQEWNRITSTAARTEEEVYAQEPFAVIDEANVADGSSSFTTAGIRVEVEEPTARFFKIPLKTMEQEWIVFRALVCCSLLSHFPSLDHDHWIQPLLNDSGSLKRDLPEPAPLELFPFEIDNALLDLDVDVSLIKFLMCFWEGCITPDYASLFRHFE